jgi:hypothetical protein
MLTVVVKRTNYRVVDCGLSFSSLKTEIYLSETLVSTYTTIWCHASETYNYFFTTVRTSDHIKLRAFFSQQLLYQLYIWLIVESADLTKNGLCRHVSVELPSFKFHENPSSHSWVITCGQTDGRLIWHGTPFYPFYETVVLRLFCLMLVWNKDHHSPVNVVI